MAGLEWLAADRAAGEVAGVRRIVFDGLDEIAQAVIRKDFCAAYETAIAEGVSTSGRSILRVPRGALLPGNSFMLGLVDRSGVRVLTGDRAYDWLNRAALPPAPATAALMAHQHEDD